MAPHPLKRLFAFLLVLAFLVPLTPVRAQQSDSTETLAGSLKIAVVNMRRIRQQSTAMQSVREQIAAFRSSFQKEVQKEEEVLRTANQELARQRSILSAEAFAAERKNFEEKLAQVQRSVQKRRQDLEVAQEEAFSVVQKHLNEIIATTAQEKEIGLILPRSQTVLAISGIEITDEILAKLNEDLPSVSVKPLGQ